MSVLSVLVFISQEDTHKLVYPTMQPISRCSSEPSQAREKVTVSSVTGNSSQLSSTSTVKTDPTQGTIAASLEQNIRILWEDVYDFVNPFGDRRGGMFNSVWTLDLDKGVIFLRKSDQFCSAPLELARQRLLTLEDFKPQSSEAQPFDGELALLGPYWEPELKYFSREKPFVGRVLRDFAHAWRHILRRPMNDTTFKKLAYATIWISTLSFTISERTGFDHVARGGPYIWVIDLPFWNTPNATVVQAGSCWFALAQDSRDGLDMVRRHMEICSTSCDNTTMYESIYVILTLRCVILCKAQGNKISWTRPEPLFDDIPASDAAINMILWAVNTNRASPQPTLIEYFPIEIQDKILSYATTSLVASAKLGCELNLGSPFCWVDRGVKIRVEETKKHRSETSPVESRICFGESMSGLSYKRERRYDCQVLISNLMTGPTHLPPVVADA